MKVSRTCPHRSVFLILMAAISAAAAAIPGPAAAISSFRGEAYPVSILYRQPSAAFVLRSYAAPDVGGCSGTMIGPRTLMTAAHCSGADKSIKFRLYASYGGLAASYSGVRLPEEVFTCKYLTHAYPDMDLILFDCAPNEKGESPGDKYGYLDFDVKYGPNGKVDFAQQARQHLAPGDKLYSIWANPVDSLGGIWHMLFSDGAIASNSSNVWSNPDPARPACGGELGDRRIGIDTNLWGVGGASGSSQISSDSHRIVVGPTSTGGVVEGPFRGAIAIVDYLQFGWADPRVGTAGCADGVRDPVNRAYLLTQGISDPF